MLRLILKGIKGIKRIKGLIDVLRGVILRYGIHIYHQYTTNNTILTPFTHRLAPPVLLTSNPSPALFSRSLQNICVTVCTRSQLVENSYNQRLYSDMLSLHLTYSSTPTVHTTSNTSVPPPSTAPPPPKPVPSTGGFSLRSTTPLHPPSPSGYNLTMSTGMMVNVHNAEETERIYVAENGGCWRVLGTR